MFTPRPIVQLGEKLGKVNLLCYEMVEMKEEAIFVLSLVIKTGENEFSNEIVVVRYYTGEILKRKIMGTRKDSDLHNRRNFINSMLYVPSVNELYVVHNQFLTRINLHDLTFKKKFNRRKKLDSKLKVNADTKNSICQLSKNTLCYIQGKGENVQLYDVVSQTPLLQSFVLQDLYSFTSWRFEELFNFPQHNILILRSHRISILVTKNIDKDLSVELFRSHKSDVEMTEKRTIRTLFIKPLDVDIIKRSDHKFVLCFMFVNGCINLYSLNTSNRVEWISRVILLATITCQLLLFPKNGNILGGSVRHFFDIRKRECCFLLSLNKNVFVLSSLFRTEKNEFFFDGCIENEKFMDDGHDDIIVEENGGKAKLLEYPFGEKGEVELCEEVNFLEWMFGKRCILSLCGGDIVVYENSQWKENRTSAFGDQKERSSYLINFVCDSDYEELFKLVLRYQKIQVPKAFISF